MLKRLAIPAVAVLLVTAIAVAVYYQQRHAVGEGYDVKCTQPNVPASALAEFVCKIQPSQDTEQGHPNRQWWYVLLAWPEGITAWLLLLTLGAIVWQAWETRKAAQSTESSALAFVTSQGPQILVTAHGTPPHDFMGEPPYVQMELQNQGPTTARNLNYEFWIEVLPFDQDRPLSTVRKVRPDGKIELQVDKYSPLPERILRMRGSPPKKDKTRDYPRK